MEEKTRPEIMRYFEFAHLPKDLQYHSKPFCDLAEILYLTLPDNTQRALALQKLLEAKDCAVRSRLPNKVELTKGVE